MVARLAHNQKVVSNGSNPTSATKIFFRVESTYRINGLISGVCSPIAIRRWGYLLKRDTYIVYIMKWEAKAKEIADEVLEEMEGGIVGSYTRDDVISGLRKAARLGMEWELENWVLQRT